MTPADLSPLLDVLVGDPTGAILDIARCEARIRAAQLGPDVPVLDNLIAEDLLFTGPDGELGTKAQDLELHASGAVRFRSHEPTELRVRLVGERVAISALKARLVVEIGNTAHQGTYRYTRVWAREGDDAWRVVGGHVAEVKPPPTAQA